MATGQPGVDQGGRRLGPAFHISQSLATGIINAGGAQKTPVKSQLLRGGDGGVGEFLGA